MNHLKDAQSVMDHFLNETANGRVFTAEEYLQASSMLVAFQGKEQAKLLDMQQQLSKKKIELVELHKTVSKAKIYIEATDEHKNCELQKQFIKSIESFIQIAKKNADVSDKY
mgnify:CR=1 FL=1